MAQAEVASVPDIKESSSLAKKLEENEDITEQPCEDISVTVNFLVCRYLSLIGC